MSNQNLNTVYIGLDPDATKERRELVSLLSCFYEVKVVELPESRKDLGECSVDEASEYLASAVNSNNYRKLTSCLRV